MTDKYFSCKKVRCCCIVAPYILQYCIKCMKNYKDNLVLSNDKYCFIILFIFNNNCRR